MKQFDIFTNPQGDVKAIKKGWNWFAALFGVFWAFFNKLWIIGIMIILISIISSTLASFLGSGIDDLISIIIGILMGIILGQEGNKWLAKDLQKKGYDLVETVSAETKEGAIATYIKNSKG